MSSFEFTSYLELRIVIINSSNLLIIFSYLMYFSSYILTILSDAGSCSWKERNAWRKLKALCQPFVPASERQTAPSTEASGKLDTNIFLPKTVAFNEHKYLPLLPPPTTFMASKFLLRLFSRKIMFLLFQSKETPIRLKQTLIIHLIIQVKNSTMNIRIMSGGSRTGEARYKNSLCRI